MNLLQLKFMMVYMMSQISFTFMSGQKETRLRTHLPLLMHQADHMAAQIEFELWNNASECS